MNNSSATIKINLSLNLYPDGDEDSFRHSFDLKRLVPIVSLPRNQNPSTFVSRIYLYLEEIIV